MSENYQKEIDIFKVENEKLQTVLDNNGNQIKVLQESTFTATLKAKEELETERSKYMMLTTQYSNDYQKLEFEYEQLRNQSQLKNYGIDFTAQQQ